MAAKDDLIAKLGELGKVLGRELSTEGTIADLQLRIREAEEEIEAQEEDGDGTDGGTGGASGAGPLLQATTEQRQPMAPKSEGEIEWVTVRVLTTLHINALHETRNQPVKMAYAGDTVRVLESDVDELEDAGYVTEL
ncbi:MULTISPECIES: DNA-packaging protein FI [Serratia]|uniref:DNA-packaging protein FI n=1 Tax=Serratia TaxID=613 RepID=UPI0014956FF4|nr:DNA-packaging protein FI [Serratia marcescens]HEJ7137385.1 DNA-packaging protein [Serratia marcescens]HEJ7181287.1 DNA-packaging protein [Serratia marcescens]HEJ7210849.1 DNA-packaging protein [Serratia marcescens]